VEEFLLGRPCEEVGPELGHLLTGGPKRANWAGRFPWRHVARDGGALAGLVLILCLSFTGQSGSEEQSVSGMTCETRGQVDAAQMIDAAESGGPPIAYRLPDKPFRNQATPPCTPNRDEEEINGGCWVQLARKPPCLGETQAEYQGKCYLPVAKRTPPLQSVEP